MDVVVKPFNRANYDGIEFKDTDTIGYVMSQIEAYFGITRTDQVWKEPWTSYIVFFGVKPLPLFRERVRQ